MKFIFGLILCQLMLLSTMSNSQSDNAGYEIAVWPDFKSAAVSYTFDDNCPNQLKIAMPMFDRYGFKMTLFTVINWNPNWSELSKAASEGHEIASHTVSHAVLGQISDSLQNDELMLSKDSIDFHIKDQKCLTIAYPNCVTGNRAISEKYYIAARGCQGFIEGSTPADFMNISSIVCGNMGSVKTGQDLIDKIKEASGKNGWVVFLIHAIDKESGYSPTNSVSIDSSLQYLNQNIDSVWEASFADVVKYVRERNDASIKEISNDGSKIIVSITDTLDNSIYDYPVTIRRQLPDGWDTLSVFQGTQKLNPVVSEINSIKYVVFKAVPGGGDVILKKL